MGKPTWIHSRYPYALYLIHILISEEILAISEKYGDERKTAIGFDEFDMSMEDMIPNENTVSTMTKLGYIKRMTVDNFRSQNMSLIHIFPDFFQFIAKTSISCSCCSHR